VTPALQKNWLETCQMAGVEMVITAVIGFVVWSNYAVDNSHRDSSWDWLGIIVPLAVFLVGWWLAGLGNYDRGECWLCAIWKYFLGGQSRCFASRTLHPTFDEFLQRAYDNHWGAEQVLQRAPGLGWKLDKLVLWMLSEGSWDFHAGQPMTDALDKVLHSQRELSANLADRVAALQQVMANEVMVLSDEATALREEAKGIVAEGSTNPDGSPTARESALAVRFATFGKQSLGIFELPSEVDRKVLIPDPLRPENLPIAATARLAQELPDDDPWTLSNAIAGSDASGLQRMAMRTGTRMATGLDSTRLRVAVKLAFAARRRYGQGMTSGPPTKWGGPLCPPIDAPKTTFDGTKPPMVVVVYQNHYRWYEPSFLPLPGQSQIAPIASENAPARTISTYPRTALGCFYAHLERPR